MFFPGGLMAGFVFKLGRRHHADLLAICKDCNCDQDSIEEMDRRFGESIFLSPSENMKPASE